MKTDNIALIISSGGVMTGSTTITSQAIPLDQIFGYAIQAIWTGTPTGNLKLQASCDGPNGKQIGVGSFSPTNWVDVSSSTQAAGGAAGTYIWNIDAAYYRWVRLSYTNSGSTGVLSGNAVVKGM